MRSRIIHMLVRNALPVVLVGCYLAGPAPAAARGFLIHAHAFMDTERTPSVTLTAEIPFDNLVFLKKGNGFEANYNVSVKIKALDRRDKNVRTAVFDGNAVVSVYEDTKKIGKRSKTSRTFALLPGRYEIEATLFVKNTHLRYRRATRVVVPDFLSSGLGFGTPEVYFLPFAREQGVVGWQEFDDRSHLRSADSEIAALNTMDSQPVVRFDLYADTGPDAPSICYLYYEVRDVDGECLLYGRTTVRPADGRGVYLLTFDTRRWNMGSYTVNLRATAGGGEMDATASVRVDIGATRAMLYEHFEDTLEILYLIASEDEIRPLETSTPEMRENEWNRFWSRRDPVPGTETNEALVELLKRLGEASKRYSRFGPAWRNDRGKVYIRYGEPESINRMPADMDRGEYEVWNYYRFALEFVFYARFQGGEYLLVEGDIF